MRIVQLNPFHYPFMGGIEHRIHHLSKRLAERHQVAVVTSLLPGAKEREAISGYEVHRLESRFINAYNPPYVSTKGLLDKLQEIDPDVVDFHYRWAPSYTRAVEALGRPWVYTSHNSFGEGTGIMRPISYLNDRNFVRHLLRCNRVVCVSEFMKWDLQRNGVPADSMVVVPNGVEMPVVESVEGDFLLYLGRLVGPKGLPYLMEAMVNVDAQLIVCGSGPERARLEKMVDSLGVREKVEFKGRVDEPTKEWMMSHCMMFIMPSTLETYGIAAAEAMSYGKPLIAARTGGLPEVVGDGGILVPPKDPLSLSNAINKLLADKRLRKDLGEKARERARSYSWDSVAQKMESVYQEVVSCTTRG